MFELRKFDWVTADFAQDRKRIPTGISLIYPSNRINFSVRFRNITLLGYIFHIRSVHFDIIKYLFIHQLMH